MLTGPPAGAALRVLYLGMFGAMSLIPLETLLRAGIEVCGVMVPQAAAGDAPPIAPLRPPPVVSELPLTSRYVSRTIVQLAWERDIPVFEMRRPGAPETIARLGALAPDVGCISCFSQRIPRSLLAAVPGGFFNLHPSLLPAYRGPAPLFWMLQQGETEGGVTIHMVDEGLDTGEIAAQLPLTLPAGRSEGDLERMHAAAGGKLLLEVLAGVKRGDLAVRPQPPGGSYFSWPTPADFQLDLSWSARRAFNFMRGTAGWGRAYPVMLAGKTIWLKQALGLSENARLGEEVVQSGRQVSLQFSPGILRAVLA